MARDFYVPVMSNCCRFDRATCYFTLDALVHYCEGIYYLGINGGKYRLLISENVSEQTFNVISDGYKASLLIDDRVKERMRETLSLDDQVTLSNLAYLMKCGLVEVRFALCCKGLFHEKSGYAEDSEGNQLSFVGSNNETSEAIEINYEKFEVTASWLSSDFDKGKIIGAKQEFESMWNGNNRFVKVIDPPDSFRKYVDSFNQGRLFGPSDAFFDDEFVLDYQSGVVSIDIPEEVADPSTFKFKAAIQSFVDYSVGQKIYLSETVNRRSLRSIIKKIEKQAERSDRKLMMTRSFRAYIDESTDMDRLSSIGLLVKTHDNSMVSLFNLFKADVCSLTVNNLREEQLWDSFFAYMLRKSANFSVPGSGKTATALGMFAYLYKNHGVRRLFVLGPYNSFDSWRFEFTRVFGNNIPLRSITTSELRDMGGTIQQHIRLDLGNYNLILLNYELFDHNPELTDALMNRIDGSFMLVMDEVHRIKAINGKRASGVVPVASKSQYTIVMTGTPIPNNYSDVYNFLHVLFDKDYDDYFCLNPKELSLLQGQSANDFNKKLSPFFCRTTKANLNVTPAERDVIISVQASQEENELFDQLMRKSSNPLALIIRILQLESNPSMLNGYALGAEEISAFTDGSLTESEGLDHVDEFVTSKTARCVQLVKDLVSSGKSVIVWCVFIKTIETISSMLNDCGIECAVIHGGVKNRTELIDGFKTGFYKVLVTNPQTLAESVSLHMTCHDAVYFEYSYNLIHLLQSKDRIHRLGLPAGQYTQYYFLETLFSRNNVLVSLDQQIHDRLNYKEQVMLDAIENDSLECFTSTESEIEDILKSIGSEGFMNR